jgi:hypothetical protein
MSSVVAVFGVPKAVYSDKAASFTGSVMTSLWKLLGAGAFTGLGHAAWNQGSLERDH